MTKLVWDQVDQRRYESGIQQGVLYPSTGPGVAWNGLVSVDESRVGANVQTIYFDGIKTMDYVENTDFQATIKAFTAPRAFASCLGEVSVVPGFVLTRQPKSRFGLAYKTGIGNDLGYKIHLVYNAMASPDGKSYATSSDSPSVTMLGWTIDSVPEVGVGHRPSAHVIIDSTKTSSWALAFLEDILYGSLETAPRLPLPAELVTLLAMPKPIEEPLPDATRIDGGRPGYTSPDILDGGRPASVGSEPAPSGVIEGGSPTSTTQDVADGGGPTSTTQVVMDGGGPNA